MLIFSTNHKVNWSKNQRNLRWPSTFNWKFFEESLTVRPTWWTFSRDKPACWDVEWEESVFRPKAGPKRWNHNDTQTGVYLWANRNTIKWRNTLIIPCEKRKEICHLIESSEKQIKICCDLFVALFAKDAEYIFMLQINSKRFLQIRKFNKNVTIYRWVLIRNV